MIFNTTYQPFHEQDEPNPNDEYDRPDMGIPHDLRERWEIEDAMRQCIGDEPVEPVEDVALSAGTEPVGGYPYEDGCGVSDLDALAPPEPEAAMSEIRMAVDAVIEDALDGTPLGWELDEAEPLDPEPFLLEDMGDTVERREPWECRWDSL